MEYSIGEFSKLTGLGIHTLRYYEQEQLLSPARSAANRRQYSDSDLAWVDFVKRLKETGMPISEMRRYAALRAAGDRTLAERLEMLTAHREALRGQMQDLEEHMEKLENKILFYRRKIACAPENDGESAETTGRKD